jgi:putative copper resistance protein D
MHMTGVFTWHDWNHWHVAFLPSALLLAASLCYLLGVRSSVAWPRSCTVWWSLGVVVTFLANQSVLGVYDMSYFSAHMIQHLLLIMVAAPLFALARPLDLLYEAGPPSLRRWLDGSLMKVITHPLVAFVAYFVFIPLAHLTGLFTAMMHHEWLHHLEQIGFLLVGYLFFRAAFGRERGRTLHPGLRVVFVMAAVPVDTFTGLAILMSVQLPFAGYLDTTPMGTSTTQALAIFHLGGAIMWIGGDALMLLACIPIVVQWVRWETVQTKVSDAELDRLGL